MTAAIKETLLSRAPQVFLMCCDFRNFSTVASALGLTQSAVSKIIANFENDQGFPLFVRNSRPLTLTPSARFYEVFSISVRSNIRPVSRNHTTPNTAECKANSLRHDA